ncbi:MAG: hypothetical protein JWN17_2292, partial [Frankiales bacterium]|nr:hypothetical protein [Frankiales bacterium]
LPVPKEEGSLLTGLLLKDTTVPAADSFDYPADYEDQFKALWKIS